MAASLAAISEYYFDENLISPLNARKKINIAADNMTAVIKLAMAESVLVFLLLFHSHSHSYFYFRFPCSPRIALAIQIQCSPLNSLAADRCRKDTGHRKQAQFDDDTRAEPHSKNYMSCKPIEIIE